MPKDQPPPPEDGDRRRADIRRLQRIASVHFLFSQHDRAEKLLRLARTLAPDDQTTNELLAAALFWRDERAEGRRIVDELERAGVSVAPSLTKYRS